MHRLAAFALMGLSAIAASQDQPSQTITLPLALPDGQALIVEHYDERVLADGGRAVFEQHHRLLANDQDGNLLLSYQPLSASCDGPAPICAAFRQAVGSQPGPIHHYRLDPAGQILPVGMMAGPSLPESTAGNLVQQREAAAPGSVHAADLRLLIRFANLPLPAPSQSVAIAEGRLSVTQMTAESLDVRLERISSATAEGLELQSSALCRVSRATGLVERCEINDWIGNNSAHPVRQRRVIVRSATGPVL
jgi:hypothetical protein